MTDVMTGEEAACNLVQFARTVLARGRPARRERAALGPGRTLILLTFGIMGAQLYPTLKYRLGYGKACTRVLIAG